MKEVMDYILKNKYVILCVAVVVLLYAFGVINFLMNFFILLVLIGVAVFVGKKMQDNEGKIKKFFKTKGFGYDDTVYYYQDKNDDNKK